MKKLLLLCAFCAVPSLLQAQEADPLAVTLPNGKIVHFDSPERKAQFEAARQRKALPAAAPAAEAAASSAPRATLGSSLDAPANGGTGIVNTAAPAFTANYYLLAPATWVGKSVTLAVAYVTPRNETSRSDGLVQMSAMTWNNSPRSGGDQDPGGRLTILATPPEASRIMQQCGTNLQWTGYGRVKVTLIKGKMSVLADNANSNQYGLMVGK